MMEILKVNITIEEKGKKENESLKLKTTKYFNLVRSIPIGACVVADTSRRAKRTGYK